MRCLCVHSEKYWDIENRCARSSVNDYIRERGRVAREIQAEAEKIDDPEEKRDLLATGLTNMLTLRKYARNDVNESRRELCEKIPFKLAPCGSPFACCGSCTRDCNKRCVQDVMQRIYFMCNNAYLGYEVDKDQQLALKELLNPRVTYEGLLSIVHDKMIKRKNKRLKEDLQKEVLSENPYIFDYSPTIKGKYAENGAFIKSYDPDTLLYDIIQWPDSGLCPYCMPASIGRIDKPGRKSKRSLFESEFFR